MSTKVADSINTHLKPIQTEFRGYQFRSRLEARWAVFFEAAELKWEYEKEGFDLGASGHYLPDFYLPELRLWLEIKPTTDLSDSDCNKIKAMDSAFRESDSKTCEKLNEKYQNVEDLYRDPEWIGNRFKVLCGNPWPGEYKVVYAVDLRDAYEQWTKCPICDRIDLAGMPTDMHVDGVWVSGLHCEWCDVLDRCTHDTKFGFFHKGDVFPKNGFQILKHPVLLSAFKKARSARFEHGERP